MDHSLAQTIELQCPQCGASFAAEVWLIVDAGARPELLARVAGGSLHAFACPNGHGGAVDAPLLLFRPGQTPALLFSPAQGTTAEQDAGQAQGLIGRLRQTLGDAWRDDWLGNLSPLPREALAALARGDETAAAEALAAATAAALPPGVARALADVAGLLAAEGVRVESAEDLERALAARPELRARLEAALRAAAGEGTDDEPAPPPAAPPQPPPGPAPEEDELPPLLQALFDWIETPDWLESYRFFLAHPELLTEEAGALLGQLLAGAAGAGDENATRLFTEHRALLQRSREAGAAAAFAEKMGMTVEELEAARQQSGPNVPPPYRAGVDRANAAEARYRATSDAAALDEAAAAWQRILDDPGFPAAPERFQLVALNNSGGVFLRRYWAGGRLPDLDRALALWGAAVDRTPAGSPDLAGRQSNLGNGLRDRYARTGRAADLEAAIAAYKAAVAGTPAGSPDLARYQNNLGLGLSDRYARTGRAEDLDAAIAAWEAAVAGTPAGSPDLAAIQNNLGTGLSARYARTGRAADLDAAIAAWEAAVAGTPAGSPDLAASQNNLGNGLRARYARTGRAADLDAAIAAWEAAVAGTPAGSPDLAMYQNNLGAGLRDRYARTGRVEELDAAIAAHEAAVAGTPAGSPDLARRQNNLGAGLRDRYARTGRAADLDAAIAAYEAAVAGTPAGSPDLAGRQNNLGNGLSDRYARTGRAADLDAAIAAWEAAVAGTPAGSPDLAGRQNNLGNGLSDRYARTGRAEDLDAAIAAWEAAVAGTPAGSPDLAGRQNNLGTGLRDRYARTGRAADLDAAIAAWEAAVDRTPAGSPDRAMYQNNLGAGLRARYARTGRAADLDAAIAAWEAAVAGTPAGSPDLAMYQNNLGAGLRDRYARTGRVEELDAAIAAYEAAVAGTPASSPDRARHQNNLGAGLSDRYARTGRAADLDAAIAAWEAAVAGTPAGSPDRAAIQNNLGAGLSDRYARTGRAADLDAAIAAWEAAVAGTPAGSPDRAAIQNNLGTGLSDRYARTGRAADLDAAIAAWEAAVAGTPAGSPDRAGRQSNLGAGLRDRYARTGRAADLDAAIATYEAAVAGTPAGSPDRAAFQNNLGNGLRDRYARTGRAADLDAAIAAYEAAVAGTPAGSPDLAMYQNNLGLGLRDRYARTGRAADLDAAIAAFLAAVATLESALLDSPVAFVLGQQSRWAGLYARAVATLWQAGRAGGALAVAEGSKSRLLTLLMSRGDLAAPPAIPAALVAREKEAAAALRAIDAASLAGHNRGDGEPGDSSRRGQARAAAVAELRAAWAGMEAFGPAAVAYVTLRRGDRPTAATLARLAGALPPGAALLSIFDPAETVAAPAGEDGERRRLLLFLWRGGEAAPRVVEAALDPDALRYDYLASYEDEVLNRATWQRLGRPATQRWRALGRPLLGPLRPHLAGIDHLLISPQSLYHQLPLHALWLDDSGKTLLDHCAVSVAPSLGVLERLWGAGGQASPAAGGPSAVLGYTPADRATADGARERDIFLGEAVAVAQRLGVAPVLDAAAVIAAVDRATDAPLGVLHLSCHGGFFPGDALASGVLLADGIYTARRFLERRLAADLVTLSACQTGQSASLGGDEMAGLSMALLSAGARSLLLGLWSVNAVTTAYLMGDFYARLGRGGAGKAEALRQTMLAFRAGAIVPRQAGFDPADAYYWAPFVLVGDWR